MKKLLIAGAAGAMIFGLTAASASTLTLDGNGWFSHTVQQSDIATVSCAASPVEVAMQVTGREVKTVKLLQQTLQGCGGSEAQVVAFKAGSKTPYAASNKVRIVANRLDTVLTFTPALSAQEVAFVRVTIADDIVAP